ncbi:hypothetical protein CP533_0543 [Ophiocordyceps camponoti-saundersi (nom. inval.)]|nr:hypothetical protein CP533_0543 [Ophiocordyceps camponoti-saundersi (nom. inval.)]
MSLAESPSLKGGDDYSASNDDASYADSTTPRSADLLTDEAKRGVKAKKRSLFGFAKRKTESSLRSASSTGAPPSLPEEQSKLSSASQATSWPSNQPADVMFPTSPSRALSNSTRVSSPAGSQIFERDVQDSTVLKPSSPAIPTHIQTENYIPPVLDDASEAITNQKLDPDAVEIVTHSSHQPASVTVTGVNNALSGGSSTPFEQSSSEWAAELASFADRVGLPPPDNASNYGSLDSADVRRLSFISFADVVQAEHTGGHAAGVVGSRDSIHLAGLTSIPSATLNRSPSPIRSPVSSQGPGTSPPTSNPGSMKGVDMSPQRKPVGSPTSSCSHNLANDLNIETMRQALRRTGSADLGNIRSMQASPVEGGGSR